VRERLRFAVVSPHLDDAILSLGAGIMGAVRGADEVSVVTVFAGDPESRAPAGRWDARAGFRTEGAAARARRDEDRRACELVGARCVWLPFGDDQYADGRDEDEVWSRVAEAVEPADLVLLPGGPLIHPDHLWVARVASERGLRPEAGLYRELPYDLWPDAQKRRHTAPSPPRQTARWIAPRAPLRSRLAKWHASGAYSSQLRWLGRGWGFRRALLRSRVGGERVAWPDGSA